MNTSGSSRSASTRAIAQPPSSHAENVSSPGKAGGRTYTGDNRERGDAFERLLRDKTAAIDDAEPVDSPNLRSSGTAKPKRAKDDETGDSKDPEDAGRQAGNETGKGTDVSCLASMFAMTFAQRSIASTPAESTAQTMQAAPLSAVADAATASPPDSAGNPPHAGLQAALNSNSAAMPLPGLANDSATAWQVSMNEPMGVGVEMSATRAARSSAAEGPAAWTLTIASSSQDAAALNRHVPRLNERLKARCVVHSHVRVESKDGHGKEDAS